MQVHIPNVCGKDPYKVRLNEANRANTFAIIDLNTRSRMELWVESAEDADRLMIAVAEAKRLLTPGCPAMTEIDTLDETVFLPCDREDGHKGSHHAEEDGRHVAWSDCPAYSDAATPCALHAGHDEPHRDINGYEWGAPEPAPCQFHGSSDETECVQCARDEADTLAAHAADAAATANAARHAAIACEPACGATDLRYVCTAQRGHDGPEHVAYGLDGEAVHSWPVTAGDRCPDCGRASCAGEGCYWPDEAGIARPEASRM